MISILTRKLIIKKTNIAQEPQNKRKMSGFISIEMYLALADELKAYKDKNQFVENEIKEMRAKNQELRVHLAKTDEQMELMYAQYKTHADQNQFLKSELKKLRTDSSILPMALIPSPTSLNHLLSPTTELPVLEELPVNFLPEDEILGDSTTKREVFAIEAPMSESIFEPVSEEPLNETIWCGPEPGTVSLIEDEQEQYILQEVPTTLPSSILLTKKVSISETKKAIKRPKVIKALSVPAKKNRLQKNEKSAPFYCRILPCENTAFQSLDEHHKHMKLNHLDKPFLCSRCPYATDSKWGLKNHENTHEKNDFAYRETQQGAICESCNIAFANSSGRYSAAMGRHVNLFH